MAYEPRQISFVRRDGRLKHYGIGVDGPARPELLEATASAAAEVVPDGAVGFTIAHDAASAGLGLVYGGQRQRDPHARLASPQDNPGALAAADGSGMACVWELEVIDFERRAWLEDVLKGGDVGSYLERRSTRSSSDARLMHDRVGRTLARAPLRRTGLVVGVWRGGADVALWQRGDLPAGERSTSRSARSRRSSPRHCWPTWPARVWSASATACSSHLPPSVEMPSRGREITLADLSSHRSGLPALPEGPARYRPLTTRRNDPYADWDAAAARAGDPAHAAAARAREALPLLELRRRAARPMCLPGGRKRATTNSCGRASPLRSGS